MQGDAGAGGVAVLGAEGVVEDALDSAGGGLVRVEWQVAGRVEAERAKVIHAEDVVRVSMGVEDRIETADAFTHGLSMKIRARVDDYIVAFPGDEHRWPSTAVSRVTLWRGGGDTDGAVTPERRNAHRGAAAEKGEGGLHGLGASPVMVISCDTGKMWGFFAPLRMT